MHSRSLLNSKGFHICRFPDSDAGGNILCATDTDHITQTPQELEDFIHMLVTYPPEPKAHQLKVILL